MKNYVEIMSQEERSYENCSFELNHEDIKRFLFKFDFLNQDLDEIYFPKFEVTTLNTIT